MNKDKIVEVRDAKLHYDAAVKFGMGITKKREQLMKVLFENVDELLSAASDLEKLENEYNMLVQENMQLKASKDAGAQAGGSGNIQSFNKDARREE